MSLSNRSAEQDMQGLLGRRQPGVSNLTKCPCQAKASSTESGLLHKCTRCPTWVG